MRSGAFQKITMEEFDVLRSRISAADKQYGHTSCDIINEPYLMPKFTKKSVSFRPIIGIPGPETNEPQDIDSKARRVMQKNSSPTAISTGIGKTLSQALRALMNVEWAVQEEKAVNKYVYPKMFIPIARLSAFVSQLKAFTREHPGAKKLVGSDLDPCILPWIKKLWRGIWTFLFIVSGKWLRRS